MGAWAEGPFENDSALDWLWEIERPAIVVIAKTLLRVKANKRGDWYLEAIAAAALLVEQSKGRPRIDLSYEAARRGLFDSALQALKIIAADDEWLEEWKSPAKNRRVLEQLRRSLMALKRASARRAKRVAARIRTVKRRKAA